VDDDRQDEQQQQHDIWQALGIHTDVPHPARIYDYLLGGTDNFTVDRELADLQLQVQPQMKRTTEENARRGVTFVGRAKHEVESLFNEWELVEPGVVPIAYWRPDDGRPDVNADRVWGYCGVARG